jgi:hypothetical protein
MLEASFEATRHVFVNTENGSQRLLISSGTFDRLCRWRHSNSGFKYLMIQPQFPF